MSADFHPRLRYFSAGAAEALALVGSLWRAVVKTRSQRNSRLPPGGACNAWISAKQGLVGFPAGRGLVAPQQPSKFSIFR